MSEIGVDLLPVNSCKFNFEPEQTALKEQKGTSSPRSISNLRCVAVSLKWFHLSMRCLGLQFSCSQMWSYRTPKHLAISRSRMRIKMRCSSSCKCSCGLTGFVKELQLVLFQVHLKELWGIAGISNSLFMHFFIKHTSVVQKHPWFVLVRRMSCTNTYLTSQFSKSANIISISEPSCLHMLYHDDHAQWQGVLRTDPSSSLASTLPKQKGRTSVENPSRIWNTQYIIQSHIIPSKMLICYYLTNSLHHTHWYPWFKTPNHGRMLPWPFSPTVFFPHAISTNHQGSNPNILGWKPSSNFWDFERIVSEFNPCRLYMSICYNLRDIGRNSCWKKPHPSLVNDSLPVIFLLSKKKKLTHETDSQSKMRHCTFNNHSFVAHKLEQMSTS